MKSVPQLKLKLVSRTRLEPYEVAQVILNSKIKVQLRAYYNGNENSKPTTKERQDDRHLTSLGITTKQVGE